MSLSEEAFSALVEGGCDACPSKKLTIEALVAQKLPLLGGEVYGAPSWGYKGEDLVRGTFLIACAACKKELFSATACPRCQADGGVARALDQENAFPLPASCGRCGSERLSALAFVPATVVYEGKRANKARTHVAPEDAGFHAYRVECLDCRALEERRNPCPLCAGQA
ncbi:hypothetical protein LZC95_32125 [Pendulispora brunnea]|uniref:Uncharacterized protein n=1 Tax=Pendulispora brunnea TaxID=2905690 RepID=A0ABZ2K2U4_9BACT